MTIDNIISLSPEEFRKSIGKLSLEQIKRRLLVLSADETRASDVAPYITIINEYILSEFITKYYFHFIQCRN